MTQPYSEDLRGRALARVDAGESIRSIAAALQISPSCIPKWKKLKRQTGGLTPYKIGGHKRRILQGDIADWLRERLASGGRMTTRQLVAELAARGIKTDRRAVWIFLRTQGLSYKKNDPAQ